MRDGLALCPVLQDPLPGYPPEAALAVLAPRTLTRHAAIIAGSPLEVKYINPIEMAPEQAPQ